VNPSAQEGTQAQQRPRKRLALFFDGTWNEPPHHTNVRRLRLMLAEHGPDGVPQRAFYDSGIGTRWYDRLTGGLFGAGLSDNVRDGYRWLTENYDLHDEIYIFGFSRGAFAARSLAGLIATCGLLSPEAPISFAQLFERYQRGEEARPIYQLLRMKNQPEQLDFEERALLKSSYHFRNLIKMVGVWETVGSIGIPFGNFRNISRRALKFHNTRLSRTIEHSYQALAIDEYRQPYWAVLWTEFFPANDGGATHPSQNTTGVGGIKTIGWRATTGTYPEPPEDDARFVEQRWFSGAHANIGGGYRSDPLPDRPLAWLQDKAIHCGLGFRSHVSVTNEDLACLPTDSYAEFLGGMWPILALGRRYTRWIMSDPVPRIARATTMSGPVAGWVQAVNERIDRSVFERCQLHPDYRPASLVEWARRMGLDLEAIIADPDQHPELCSSVTRPGIERRPIPTASVLHAMTK
jgi:uncharacterized protein (DUF2235 family)